MNELANTTGVSTRRLIEEIRSGRLRAYKFGERDLSVYPEDFEDWRASRATQVEELDHP